MPAIANFPTTYPFQDNPLIVKLGDPIVTFAPDSTAFLPTISSAQFMPSVIDYDSYGVIKRYLDFRGLVGGTSDRCTRDTQVVSAQDFTLECWVKITDLNTPQNANGQWIIAERGPNATANFNYQLNWSKPNKWFNFSVRNNNSTVTFTASSLDSATLQIENNQWRHIAAVCSYDEVKDSCYLTVYVDGQPGTTSQFYEPTGRYIPASNDFVLGLAGFGNTTNCGLCLIGSLDEVRVWSEARTQEQIIRYKNKRLRCAESNLIAYYRMNEGSGSTLGDCAGSAENLTIIGCPWITN